MKLQHAGVTGVLAVLLMGGAANALAQKSDDIKVTLGLKLWLTEWDTPLVSNDPVTGNNVQTFFAHGRIAPIPSLSVRYRDFLASTDYFVKTNYGFGSQSRAEIGLPVLVTNAVSAKREEFGLNVGYFVVPQLAVTVGYKRVDQHYTQTESGPGLVTATGRSTTKNEAVTVGILGSAPIGGGFNMYGNGSIGPARASAPGGFSGNGYYGSTELGVAYPIAANTVLSLGYKYQLISIGVFGQRARDITNGVVAGLSYTF